MPDLVVTVPMDFWRDWLDEGDLPGDPSGGAFDAYDFSVGRGGRPAILPGERVYVVAHGRVRGYAPLIEVVKLEDGRWSLVRKGGAVAVTTDETIRGFRGWRERWWKLEAERPFPEWQTEGVVLQCDTCDKRQPIVGFQLSGGRWAWCWPCLERRLRERRTDDPAATFPEWALAAEQRGLAMVAAEEHQLAATGSHR
jgi:hypothetical protein